MHGSCCVQCCAAASAGRRYRRAEAAAPRGTAVETSRALTAVARALQSAASVHRGHVVECVADLKDLGSVILFRGVEDIPLSHVVPIA